MRSGNEPMTARSPLRLRLSLAIFGVIVSAAAAIGVGLAGNAVLATVFAVIAAIAFGNVIVVVIRIRQGPRFQPGRDVPPLPSERTSRPARQASHPLALRTRERAYVLLMGGCLLLLLLAWALVWRYSLTAAVVMSVAALCIPPIAVIIANAGSANRRR